MEQVDSLFSENLEPWIESLPKYQQARVNALLQSGLSPEDAAKAWLSANVENTFPFGADRGKGILLNKIWDEIEKFLCGADEYSEDRAKLQGNSNVVHTYFVGVLSAAIAPALGTSAVFLAPVVALLLATIGRISVRAWCETRTAQRRASTEEGSN